MAIPKLRHFRASLMAMVLMVAALPGLAATNIALGKTATASSLENTTFPASAAVDGDAVTRWASSFVDPSWIAIDLGSAQTFNRVVLRWEAAFGSAYQIQTSTNNSTWTTVYTKTAGTGGVEDFTFPAATARYVRMYGTTRTTIAGAQYGYSLYEFEVYSTQFAITASAGANGSISPSGSTSVTAGASQTYAITPASGYVVDAVTVDGASVGAVTSYTFSNVQAAHTISATFKAVVVSTNLALGKTATASGVENDTVPASLAVDGNGGTRWSSSFVDPSWIAIDLGASVTFNRVVLKWEAAFGSAYQIQTSTNNSTWTTVYTKTAGTGGTEDFTFPAATARYIRMYGTARTTIGGAQYGYSLYEFEVYNTGVVPTQFTLTASAGANGTISPTGAVKVNQGSNQTFAITPASGYAVSAVTVDGASVGAVTSYTFSNVQAAHTISATFKAVTVNYVITASAGTNGTISPTGAVTVAQAANQTFTITPATGYAVNVVTVDGASAGAVTSYTFSNVQAAHTISATFKALVVNYAITASAGANGSISPSGTVTVAQGASQSFTITPASGYSVSAVTVDGASAGAVTSYTFSNVQAAHSISATFAVASAYAWHDEFDGPYLDSSKWVCDIGTGSYGWGNGEWEGYTSSKDNVAIENGNLVITARKEDFFGQHFTSARLLTRGKYNFKHGHIEARIKFPTGGQMIWPCFWMLGDTSMGWPKTNEIDIAEMFGGTYQNAGDNVVGAHCFWWQENDFTLPYGAGNYADYGLSAKLSTSLGSAYRNYALDWDATTLKAYVWDDGQTFQQANPTPYWNMTINGQGLEELNNADYLLLNFAIGQPQSGMTSADQAALLPQKMYVDYIRVTDTATTPAVVTDKVATQPHGNLGVMADATVCPTNLAMGTDANFYIWSNTLTAGTSTRPKSVSLVYNTGAGWWGAGVATINRYNRLNYAAGALHVSVKTASPDPFLIGVSGGDGGNSWVTLTSGGTKSYDFARDNQWHDITIPMTNLSGADFTDVSQFFMAMSGATVTANQAYEFDNIYWSENDANNIVKPVGTKFGVLTSTTCDAGNYNYATGGSLNNWNASGNGTITAGATGASNSFNFVAPAAVWYGMGLAPTKLYNLSAFATGHLHFSLKVAAGSSTAMFQIGLKSPGGSSIRESWIKMGSAAYPVVADGVTRDYSIPAQEFLNSDLSAVSQLFMVSGVAGPMNMDVSNIYWTNN